jgi:hypothetical protein
MNITPVFCIGGTLERPLLLLFGGLFATISTILAIFMISCVDFPIVPFLLREPLAMGLKESSPGIRSFDAYVSDYEQIGHRLRLLHGYLIHNFDIANPIMEGVDDFDVINVWNNVSSIAKTFHVVPGALIMLLLDDL